MEEKEFKIMCINRKNIGSKSHALISIIFEMRGKLCETWVLFSGQDTGIEVGNLARIDMTLPDATWVPLMNKAREFLRSAKE